MREIEIWQIVVISKEGCWRSGSKICSIHEQHPQGTRRKLNVLKTFRRRQGHLSYVGLIYVLSVTYPEFFWGRPVHTWNSPPWLAPRVKFSKVAPLKMHSLPLSVLRFHWKWFSKLFFFLVEWFLKNSYIHTQKLYGYKPVRAAKRSELNRCS